MLEERRYTNESQLLKRLCEMDDVFLQQRTGTKLYTYIPQTHTPQLSLSLSLSLLLPKASHQSTQLQSRRCHIQDTESSSQQMPKLKPHQVVRQEKGKPAPVPAESSNLVHHSPLLQLDAQKWAAIGGWVGTCLKILPSCSQPKHLP